MRTMLLMLPLVYLVGLAIVCHLSQFIVECCVLSAGLLLQVISRMNSTSDWPAAVQIVCRTDYISQ